MTDVTIGSMVKVDHPITCVNPTEYFTVFEMRYDLERQKLAVRGEDTCWFGSSMIVDVKEK